MYARPPSSSVSLRKAIFVLSGLQTGIEYFESPLSLILYVTVNLLLFDKFRTSIEDFVESPTRNANHLPSGDTTGSYSSKAGVSVTLVSFSEPITVEYISSCPSLSDV